MAKIIKELQDLRYLEWSKIRHSSGTAGSFLKSYEIINGRKKYYKLSDYDRMKGIVGHECINEIIVDRLLTMLNIEHLEYELIHALIEVNGHEYETYLCASWDFKDVHESKIALDTYYEMECEHKEEPLEFCARMGWHEYIYPMLILDYLIINRDRHGANIEVLRNRKNKSIRLAPLFDHGLSLAFSCHDETLLQKFDPLLDRRIQCFVGSNSCRDNLSLIPKEHLLVLPVFDEHIKNYLFEDLDDIISNSFISVIWNILCRRAEEYENICFKK